MNKNPYIKPGYWKDWYWNKGGRERILATRSLRDYENYKRKLREIKKIL